VDVVEISQGVLDTAAEQFTDINHGVVGHPKFRAIVMDGASYLALTDWRYDLILNDSIWPYYAGNSGLYTREYFSDGLAHLNPGGIMTSWLPVDMPPESLRSLLHTFCSVFPDVSLWLAVTHANRHALLVGSTAPIRIDLPAFLQRFERYARRDLEEVHLDDPLYLLDAYRTDREGIARWVEGAPLHTVDQPVLEFAPRTKLPTDWVRAYGMLLRDETTIFPRLDNLAAVGGEQGEIARKLQAAHRATKLVMRGLIEQERHAPDYARQFELALREQPEHPGARVLLAELQDWTARRFVDLEDLGFDDLLIVAGQFLDHGNAAEAIEALVRAVESRPESSQARHNLALAYMKVGRAESALGELNEVVARDPEHAAAFKLRGTAHSALGQHEPAIADFSRSIELDPRDEETFVNRGLAHAARGELASALDDLNRAISLEPGLADAYYARAEIREASGAPASRRSRTTTAPSCSIPPTWTRSTTARC
jgi:tetratricopeptide (TPR) repeat protein